MEQAYWLGRSQASVAMALAAIDAEARLGHYDRAGRYSVMAANAERPRLHAPGLEPAWQADLTRRAGSGFPTDERT
jgi:hypothetical protein